MNRACERAYTYDVRNRLEKAGTRDFIYDVKGRLSKVNDMAVTADKTVDYTYDAYGRTLTEKSVGLIHTNEYDKADKPHDPRPSQSSLVQVPDDPNYPNLDRPQGGVSPSDSPTSSAKPKKSFGQKVKDFFGNTFKKKEKK